MIKRILVCIVLNCSIYHAIGQADSCGGNYMNDKDLFLYLEVDELPKFEYKNKKLMEFVYENLKWPNLFDGQGTIVASFVIKKNGDVSNIKIVKKLFADCDEEVERVLKMMPKWKPGKINNKAVDVIFFIPIHFKLE